MGIAPACRSMLITLKASQIRELKSPMAALVLELDHLSTYSAVQPPSMERLAPVICAPPSLHRKSASEATCSTVTNSFVGWAASGGDDTAPTAPLHTWNGCTDRMEGGGQVDREYRVPLIDWKFLDWRDVLDARVINEHIDAAERLLGKRDHLGDFARLSHVRGRIDSLHPE